jgi:hypothetical protein
VGNGALSAGGGASSTAVGYRALFSADAAGLYDTAVGDQALFSNTAGFANTATGAFALLKNTTGSQNTANGEAALYYNTSGNTNTATGAGALGNNLTGDQNTASGAAALITNTIGHDNTAVGFDALDHNTRGSYNSCTGARALFSNTEGSANTAVGDGALANNIFGNRNIALGTDAGLFTQGDRNIDIGNQGAIGDSDTIRIGSGQGRTFIAGISGAAVAGSAVVVDGNGQLGVAPSSERFKDQIRPMDRTSEAIRALKPVTFRYKSDNTNTPQFGLIAEEVAEVNPDLVVHNKNGEIYTVRYDAVNAMLLNEFLKEHRAFLKQQRTVHSQEATIAQLKNGMERLAAHLKEQDSKIAKVSAQLATVSPSGGGLEARNAASQVVLSNH